MLTLSSGSKVFLASQPVDLRRGHDGLCALVRGTLALDPFSGSYFVFVGKARDRIKCLFWDRGGFVIYYKRLARGRFRMPKVAADADRVVLDGTQLAMLLGGFDVGRSRREPAWEPAGPKRPEKS
jgi:transposase